MAVTGSAQPLRRRVVVRGRVHGVGYRASCGARARAAGVAGWVRNVADGTVEAVFEGSPAAVDQLVAWCRQGPPTARVTHVDIFDEPPRGEQRFDVR